MYMTCFEVVHGTIYVDNGPVDRGGEEVSGMDGERSIDTYTLLCVKWILGAKLL